MATGQEERARDLKAGVVRDSAMFSDASSTVHVLHLARPLSRPNCAARMDADEVCCKPFPCAARISLSRQIIPRIECREGWCR